MNPTKSQPWHGLLERIIASLESGGRISVPVLDYIEANLFAPDVERLSQFLTDDNDSERDSLLDLIFFPDEALQLALEPLLGVTPCSAGDEATLLDRLIVEPIDAMVRLPDNRPLVRIRLPGFIKSRFLARLNLAWHMDPEVAAAIDAGVSPRLQLAVKVRLRNAAISFSAHRRRFLAYFFERMADSAPDHLVCLDLVLPLPLPLSLLPAGIWIGTAFMGCAFTLLLLCVRDMRGADTTLRPDRPNTRLVRSGPYRLSRNPIYLGLLSLQAGLALAIPSPWSLSLLPLAWLILDLYVVTREERYLSRRFGAEYRQYLDDVPRWL